MGVAMHGLFCFLDFFEHSSKIHRLNMRKISFELPQCVNVRIPVPLIRIKHLSWKVVENICELLDSLKVLSPVTDVAENDKRPMEECPDLDALPLCR